MGTLHYGSRVTVEVDDRTLTHLQIVIIGKLRRSETFAFSWRPVDAAGDGRSTLWMHPYVELEFLFTAGDQPIINRTWLAQLNAAANSTSGLLLLPEPEETVATASKAAPTRR